MPESFEAYRRRVRGYLANRDPLQVLRCTPTELEQLVADLPRTAAARRPKPEKWSVLEIVAHMFDAELAFGWRIRSVVAEPGTALPWFDQDKWADRLQYISRHLGVELRQFRALREANLVVIESVPQSVWPDYYGVHEVRGRQTLADFVEMEAAHDLNHLRQIGERVEQD